MRGAQWVTAASGTNPVTGVTYINSGTANPTGALTAVTYGSADSDNFAYNPNTGRRSSYQFSVNGVNDKGTLTWNANGTLSKLVVADSLAATLDSQTCNYLYDDLQRVSSANCGSPWAQSFTYDAFGNISKTGSSVFQPVYSTANTNQFSSIPGVTVSYDANGKLLTDNLNTYTWDTNWGNPASINTTNLIYDAIGQMVEQQNGTIYTQILYGPAGKTAIMNGQTLTKAFVNLPGGGTAIYTPLGLVQYRHADWLGSSRLTSTSSRTVYSDSAYAPFGEQYAKTGMADVSFTGDNADTTSTLYDFIFRENSPSQGRWTSPDPAGLGAVDAANPQSWNRFAYVNNSPLSFVDPLGLNSCEPGVFCIVTTVNGCGPGMTMYNNYCVPSCPGQGLAIVNGYTICGPPSAIFFFQNQVVAGVNTPQGPQNQGSGGNSLVITTPVKCVAAKAKAASLWQKLNSPEAKAENKTYFKELGAGAVIGCGVGAVPTIGVTGGVGTPVAVGECAVGAVEGAIVANFVYTFSHLGLMATTTSDTANLAAALAEAGVACR